MRVILSKDSQRNYSRLPKHQQTKIKKKLTALQQNPHIGKKLGGKLEGDRSLNVWPYRIIYSINKKQDEILVSNILHRQGAYN